ncbi:MAG: hypothetical protein CMN31_19820, partial [Sandaracinus sp.]|nr:hypothetical protein [Sandaracinus sp.]
LDACARATLDSASYEHEPTQAQIAVRIAERALRTTVAPDPDGSVDAVTKRAGSHEAPDADETPLAFGFEAAIFPGGDPTGASRAARADVHALLFDGSLWAFVRGRRIVLARGPIMLAVQRMVVAVRALVDAWEAGRSTNVRLRSGGFAIGLRLGAREEVALSLAADGAHIRAAALDVPGTALPILRLASDSLRALCAVDRAQSKNLRVGAMRDEIRALRRAIKEQVREDGFVNEDPDRVRMAMPSASPNAPKREEPALAPSGGGLRYEERWRVALDDLDATSTFFCGDRLVLCSSAHTVAVDRGTGDVLWAREAARMTLMAGTAMLRLDPDGDVELCDVSDGEPYAVARIRPKAGAASSGLVAGGRDVPPMAVLPDGQARLVALDLRTGEPRWRFNARRGGSFHLARAGRLLLVACEGAVHAIDVASGEDVWRFAARTRFVSAPAVVGDTVVAVGQGGPRTAWGIDLLTGEERWKTRLRGAAMAAPIGTARAAAVALDRDRLVAIEGRDGDLRWEARDPGVGTGGATLTVDDLLVVNAPGGAVAGLDLETGEPRWSQVLGDPLADEIPRRLEPVLRGGALFVPAANVHVLRPRDGKVLGELPTDLVPDRVHVDERGWVYVAEESGHVAAYAPAPTLRLIPGGG